LVSRRYQGAALLVFLVLGLVEEATVSHAGWLNERSVAVCAAGLVAGPSKNSCGGSPIAGGAYGLR
jgi:hypothetical protein